MESWSFILDIVTLLGSCLVLGGLFSRFGQSPIVGYLLAGIILGRVREAGLIQSEAGLEDIAELGVALLLFSLGLEFSWAHIKKFGSRAILIGVMQVGVTAVVATLSGQLFGLSWSESVAVGAMVCLSSTACVLRVLSDRRELDAVHGRNSISILLMQDIAVVPLAILMTVLAGGGESSGILETVAKTFLSAAALIAALYVILNKFAVYTLGRLTLERNRELTLLLAVVSALGATWTAHSIGLSPALGAFAAGMFLGGSAFATQIRADISSLRVIFLTLFFGAAGMVADPFWIFDNLLLVVSITALLLVTKTVVIWVVMVLGGHSHSTAVATGVTLCQVGEFAFVLGTIAKNGGVVSSDVYLLIVSSTILSLFLTPYTIAFAPKLGLFVEGLLSKKHKTNEEDSESKAPPEILIIGFGPTGYAVGASLASLQKKVLVLDLNRSLVDDALHLGLDGMVGDALRLDVLEHIGISSAEIVIITIPARYATLTLLQHVRRLAPNALTFVRTRYQVDAPDLKDAGATAVIGDEEEVGNKLRDSVLSVLHV